MEPPAEPLQRPRLTFRDWTAIAALLACATWLVLSDLGASSLHDGDEALYATVARAMARSGNLLTPTYWGEPFLHKPPLPYWLMAASLRLYPHSPEFALRLPSALAALILLALVFFAARRLANTAAATLATATLFLNHQLLYEHAARSAAFDALLTLTMFGALVAGLRADRSRAAAWSFAALLGATALIKLPMIVFPAAVVLAHHALAQRRTALALARSAGLGVAVIALPWHVCQLALHGRAFFDAYVRYEIFGRAGGSLQDLGPRALIHLEAAWMSFLPWSPLILVALIAVAAGFGRRQQPDEARSIAAYALFVLVFFCFIAAKWPWYSIPAYPAAAVVLAVFLERAFATEARRYVPAAIAAIAGLGWLLLRVLRSYAPAARPSYQWPEHDAFLELGPAWHGALGPVLLALLLALAVLPALGNPNSKRRTSWASSSAALLVVAWQGWAVLPVPREHHSAIQRLAERIGGRGIARVYALGFGREPRYGDRQEPLSSFYLLGIADAEIVSCATTDECAPPSADAPSALVISARGADSAAIDALVSDWKSRPSLEVWRIDPHAPDGFARL